MRDELYINGYKADMGSGTSISLNYKSNFLTDISKIVSNNSYTIRLPKTANNLRIIECSHIPSAATDFPYLVHAGTLVRDGVEIVRDANVVLLSVGEQIEIALSWGNVTNFEALVNSGKSLQELSYGMVAGVDYTNWVIQSIATPQFPRIDYGFKEDDTSVWYHPTVTAKWIMDKIASEYGIVFEFPTDRAEMMERMRIPLLTRKDAQKQIDDNTKSVTVTGFKVETEGGTRTENKFLFSSFWTDNYYLELLKDGINYGNIQPKFSNLSLGIKISCSLTVSGSGAPSAGVAINMINSDTGDILAQFEPETIDNLGNNSYRYNYEIDENVTDIPYSWFAFWVTLGANAEISSFTGTFTFAPYATNVEAGQNAMKRYYYVPNLPDISQLDFLKAITSMLGLFAVPAEADHIKFIPFDRLVENKSKAVDWSERMVQAYMDKTPQKITYTLDNFAQHNRFKYKEDDTVRGKYDGDITVDNETLDYERDAVELPFAACDTKNGIASIPLYSYDAEGELEYDDSVEPRIVLLHSSSGIFSGLEWESLLTEYYSSYRQIVDRPKVIVENIRLSPVELQALDLTVPVYLSQYGSYWAVINVKTKDNDICEVKLLKM